MVAGASPRFYWPAAFIVYSTWAALQGNRYTVAGTGYLSPFYSPLFDSETRLVARLSAFLRRDGNSLGTGRIPVRLLLLSRCLL